MGLDVYKLMKEGKSPEEVNELIQIELNAAAAKVEEERIAAEAEAKKQEMKADLLKDAVSATVEYFAIVNPSMTEEVIKGWFDIMEHTKYVSYSDKGNKRDKRMNIWDSFWSVL